MTAAEFKIADPKHETRKEQWKALFAVPTRAENVAHGYEVEQEKIALALQGIVAPGRTLVPFAMARKVQSGLFLHGPPGCGKTLLVKAAAAKLDVPLVIVQPAHVIAEDIGTTCHLVSSLFAAGAEVASAGRGAVVFWDELESYGKRTKTGAGWEVFLSNLLKHMDNLSSSHDGCRLAFVAATNNAESCEPALLSRLSNHIAIGPPDDASRRAYLAAAISAARETGLVSAAIDVEAIVVATRGRTLRQIAQGLEAVNARFTSAEACIPRRVTQQILVDALASAPTTSSSLDRYDPSVV